ncbi:MAG: RNA polymerase sigma factor [Bacteroidota bacterium]
MEESHLISLIKKKDESAFKYLVETYSDRVYNTVLSFVQHAEDAEDIAQEVFIEVYQSIDKFKNESKLFTWIYRIAVSKSLDHLKSKKRKKRFAFVQSLFGDEGISLLADKPHFEHPGVLLENKEHSKVLFFAISKLPENQQTVFNLNKVEGLSYNEVSGVMQVSVSSVESLLFRANQNLKKLLENYYQKNL